MTPSACDTGALIVCYTTHTCDNHGLEDCAKTTTPHGLAVVSWVERHPAGGGKEYVFYGVQVHLTSNYVVSLLAVNYFGGDASPVSAELPVLTRDQLQRIAIVIADQILP